jgi:hypothetical protein
VIMKPLTASRRRVLSFLGSAPLAARAAAESTISRLAGVSADGLGDASMRITTDVGEKAGGGAANVPYEKRLIAASDLVRVAGVPEALELTLRDRARYTPYLDPDLASKRSWSLNVKIATQRERNYERELGRIHQNARYHRGMGLVKAVLGFDWPW